MKTKIVLDADTFLYEQGEKGFMYNGKAASVLFFDPRHRLIRQAMEQWNDLENLYVAHIDYCPDDAVFMEFMQQIKEKKMGAVLREEEEAPLSYPPLLVVKNSIERLPEWYEGTSTLPVLHYLRRLDVFLGGKNEGEYPWPLELCPTPLSGRLDLDALSAFLSRCDKKALKTLSLYVSEWNREQIEDCMNKLEAYKPLVRLYFVHPDPAFNSPALQELTSLGWGVTQICPPSPLSAFAGVPGRKYQLLVDSEDAVAHWEALLAGVGDLDYALKPVAGDNLDFFRKNVFLSETEILSQKLSKKDIFRHQALNVNYFGGFFVFPDGAIHPAPDAPAVGTLEDPLHQTILKELEENHAWRRTRRLQEPCKDCLYHDLCPSPSAYESILGVPACTCWIA